jgi:Ca2+-transporting ATPase
MRRPPLDPREPVLEKGRLVLMGSQGFLLALVAVLAFGQSFYVQGQSLEQARTLTFVVMVLAQLFHAFACRSTQHSILTLGFLTNRALMAAVVLSALLQGLIIQLPWTQEVFKVVPLDAEQWVLAVGLALAPLVLGETRKVLKAPGSTRQI